MARTRKLPHVALVAYPGCSLLELVGAQYIRTVASLMSSLDVTVVGPTTDFTPSSTGLGFRPQKTLAEAPAPDVMFVVGGGDAALRAADDAAVLYYVRREGQRAPIVASSGTGSLLLAAAGLLYDRKATTHWAYADRLEEIGIAHLSEQWVEDERFLSGPGSASAIDLSLRLVARLHSERLARIAQTSAEWDPAPHLGRLDRALMRSQCSQA